MSFWDLNQDSFRTLSWTSSTPPGRRHQQPQRRARERKKPRQRQPRRRHHQLRQQSHRLPRQRHHNWQQPRKAIRNRHRTRICGRCVCGVKSGCYFLLNSLNAALHDSEKVNLLPSGIKSPPRRTKNAHSFKTSLVQNIRDNPIASPSLCL